MNKNPLEKDIERIVNNYAKSRGLLTYKFTSPNRRSVPDRMFISGTGFIFFIEFKRLGKLPTPAQSREINRMTKSNVTVYVVDNVAYGKGVIDCHVIA